MRTGNINVKVQRLWESTIDLTLAPDTIIGDALVAAGLPRNSEARVNWELARENDILDDGDVIVVATKKNTQG